MARPTAQLLRSPSFSPAKRVLHFDLPFRSCLAWVVPTALLCTLKASPAGSQVFFHQRRETGSHRPYVPYEFEFTKTAREGENDIDVLIRRRWCRSPTVVPRLRLIFGIHPGFEACERNHSRCVEPKCAHPRIR